MGNWQTDREWNLYGFLIGGDKNLEISFLHFQEYSYASEVGPPALMSQIDVDHLLGCLL
jgi:hypothetical protein